MHRKNSGLHLFSVKSVAIVGASEEKGRIGSGLYKSISTGFPGNIYCVNPKHQTLGGRPCYPTVLQLPEVPTHAVIAVARGYVLQCLRQCAKKGISNVVVISSGFKEADAWGAELEREMEDFCHQRDITLLGPNTLGFIDTAIPYNGTFLPDTILPGSVSIISQSGGVGMALLAALRDLRCGIAKWIGIGNEAVLDAADLLAYLAKDPATKAIAVCFEGLRDLPGFLRLAAEVNREKAIVLLRDGKGTIGMRAAASHTGTMAQSGTVMDGLVKQFGLLEAKNCRECAAMLKALAIGKPVAGNRTALLTNTAGPSILAMDVLEPAGVDLPQPTLELQKAIDGEVGVAMGLKNPADISSTGLTPQHYGIAARCLLASGEYDSLLAFFSLNSHLLLPDLELTEAVRRTGKPAVACFLGSFENFSQYNLLPEQEGIPCYCDPNDAAAAMTALVHWGKAASCPAEEIRRILTDAQQETIRQYLDTLLDGTLPERESKTLLRLAGMEVDVPVLTSSAEEAAEAAGRCGYPVALKLHSNRITHKSDVGGVRLNIWSETELRAAYLEMLPTMRALDPEALVTVQAMRPDGFELILGAVRMPGTGPLIMAGMGGVYSEVLRDTAFRMVPATVGEPLRMLEALRCAPILNGFRGQALNKKGGARLLQLLSDLMEAFPRIREIDINPCRVYPNSTAVLDARIVLDTLEIM